MTIESYIKEQIRHRLDLKGRGARIALARHLGVRPDAITRLTTDVDDSKEQRHISAEELVKIADFFDCSLDVLANPKMENSNSKKLNYAFNRASPEVQDAVLNFVQALIRSENSK